MPSDDERLWRPEAVGRAFEGKSPVAGAAKPHFIVAYGPPASGKSSIVPVLSRELSSEFASIDKSIVSVNVDDIFQGGEVGARYKIYRQNLLATPDAGRRTVYTQRLYVFFRWIADQISDGILNQALAARYDVLWETTGSGTWPRHEIARLNSYGYQTIVAYPLVAPEELVSRAAKRAVEEGQEGAPPDQIRAGVLSAQSNLVELLPRAVGVSRKPCPEGERFGGDADACRASRVILIDNTGRKGEEKIAFDSQAPEAHCVVLEGVHAKVKLAEPLRASLKLLAPACARL